MFFILQALSGQKKQAECRLREAIMSRQWKDNDSALRTRFAAPFEEQICLSSTCCFLATMAAQPCVSGWNGAKKIRPTPHRQRNRHQLINPWVLLKTPHIKGLRGQRGGLVAGLQYRLQFCISKAEVALDLTPGGTATGAVRPDTIKLIRSFCYGCR